MKKNSIALMVFGDADSTRNALEEEKYKNLALAFRENGFDISSVIYNDEKAEQLSKDLLQFDAVLVWINPVEQGNNRKRLDALLIQLSKGGCFVSAHPEVILKIGTKDVLYKTRETEFGGDVELYSSFEDFKERFLTVPATRILKQYRGNGGDGVFKIDASNLAQHTIIVTHAKKGDEEKILSTEDFFAAFKIYFCDGGILIDQPWNERIINGMVRCYLTGTKVSGFGYQEVNALYPNKKPGKRFYFSEDCGLFRDLREIMENKWVTQLQQITGTNNEMMPVIWDADFFINNINTKRTHEKYTLCEINVSCVSPFPESAIPYMVEEVRKKLTG
ncbi:MAG TPA: Cj0069 family protein [Chitinophagaceae bacterium]|nr:Cj0069 family protein [Chitinophagaceae bacterium]